MLEEFLAVIGRENPMHRKYLEKSMQDFTAEDESNLLNLMNFYLLQGYTVTAQAQCLLHFVNAINEEVFYFMQNDYCYRYHSFAEAAHIYEDRAYMENYLIGLGLTTYLWYIHRGVMKFFIDFMERTHSGSTAGRNYLEVGIGHGEYFVQAMKNSDYSRFYGIDISPSAVSATNDFINFSMGEAERNYEIGNIDFFDLEPAQKYDTVVMGEIIEHVEEPAKFLERLRLFSHEETRIFISTAINAPQPDHIYLFRSVADVETLFSENGFEVIEKIILPTNGVTIEKAEKRKMAIVVAYILKICTKNDSNREYNLC